MRFVFIVLILLVSQWANASNYPTVLISIDGLAQHQLIQFKPKTLTSLANNGLAANALVPVFPTKTFPNHVSIITGKYPAEHGIVHNAFYSRSRNALFHKSITVKDPSWLKFPPIWVTAEQQGVATASYFWPQSDAELFGKRPQHFFPYSDNFSNEERVEQMIQWLSMPSDKRPMFIASYFSLVDSANHKYGTQSPEVINAINTIDSLLEELIHTLEQKKLKINLIIVSDHGMADVGKKLDLKNVLPLEISKDFTVVNGQTQLYLYQKQQLSNQQLMVQAETINSQSQGSYCAYTKLNWPKHWQFNNNYAMPNDVIPDLIVNAQAGVIFIEKDYIALGTHGYDPKDTNDMEGVFIATGPNIKAGRIAKFENVYVYAFIAKLIDLTTDDRNIRVNHQLQQHIVL
ncbi:alkaline phosphatase family protein [Colwellia sp. MEBiC06753]